MEGTTSDTLAAINFLIMALSITRLRFLADLYSFLCGKLIFPITFSELTKKPLKSGNLLFPTEDISGHPPQVTEPTLLVFLMPTSAGIDMFFSGGRKQ